MLVNPIESATLYLYLAITPKVISSLLCSKRDNIMKYNYYVIHVLNNPEERYSSLEKYTLCLVITARKLKLYFQALAIKFLTHIPLRYILHKLDILGRTSK